MRASVIASLVVVITSVGCKRLETGAREEFGKKYSCPEERVDVRARSDLHYGDLIQAGASKPSPPPEVVKDPERLAKWESDKRAEDAALRERLNRHEVFEAKGCDHVAFLGCGHPEGEEGVVTSQVDCWEIPPDRVPG